MLCAPLDWQYAELPSSASDAVLYSVLVRKIEKTKKKKHTGYSHRLLGSNKKRFTNNTWYEQLTLHVNSHSS